MADSEFDGIRIDAGNDDATLAIDCGPSDDASIVFQEAGSATFRIAFDGGDNKLYFYADQTSVNTKVIEITESDAESDGTVDFNYDVNVDGVMLVGTTPSLAANGAADNLVVCATPSSSIGISILNQKTDHFGQCVIAFGDDENTLRGAVKYFNQGDTLTLRAGGVDEVDINTSRATFNSTINIPTATPGSASATGTTGDIAWDAVEDDSTGYLYICTGTDKWQRVAIEDW